VSGSTVCDVNGIRGNLPRRADPLISQPCFVCGGKLHVMAQSRRLDHRLCCVKYGYQGPVLSIKELRELL
jgi:hypothetical protein